VKNKILIVDDEKNIRLLLKEELTDEGYDVIMADSGEMALKMIKDEKPISAVAADHYVVKSSDFGELKGKIKEILSFEA
jgi:DNA-binding response OmpR family regulator